MSLIRAKKSVHVRCSKEKCKKRAVFDRHPDEYKVPRKCEGCGGTRFRVIRDRLREAGGRQRLCSCEGRVFGDLKASNWSASKPPHVRGSTNCWYRKDGTMRMPGDPDFSDPDYEPDTVEQEDSITHG